MFKEEYIRQESKVVNFALGSKLDAVPLKLFPLHTNCPTSRKI